MILLRFYEGCSMEEATHGMMTLCRLKAVLSIHACRMQSVMTV